MKESNNNFHGNFSLDRGFKSLPDIPVSQLTKDKILRNVLKSKKSRSYFSKNFFEMVKPLTFAAAMLIFLVVIQHNFSILPQSAIDGFYLTVEANVRGAEVYIENQRIGKTPVTQKVKNANEIKITMDGYIDWTAKLEGSSIDQVLENIQTSGKYRLFRSLNTLKLVAELDPIQRDTVFIQTETPGAVIRVNGQVVGTTPFSLKVTAMNNFIEVIQDNKEKVSFNLVYDGDLKYSGQQSFNFTNKGYQLDLPSQELYKPKDSMISEGNLMVLEYNSVNYRIKVINLVNGDYDFKSINEFLVDEGDHFLFNNGLYSKDFVDNWKGFLIDDTKTFIFDEDGIRLLKGDGTIKTIESNMDARLVQVEDKYVYYQIQNKIYSANIENGHKTLLFNLDSEGTVSQMVYDEKNAYLLIDGNIYNYDGEKTSKIINFGSITHFTLSGDSIFVFNYDRYINIWEFNLEKENMRKIY